MLVPILVAQTLANAKPNLFYYMWYGWYGILRIIGSILLIPGLVVLFHPKKDLYMDPYIMICIILCFLFVIPTMVTPLLIRGIDRLWDVVHQSKLLLIPKEPNYIFTDMVFPSLAISILLLIVANNTHLVMFTANSVL